MTSTTAVPRLYFEGDELYAAMLHSIAAARRAVYFETYIFSDDEIGRQFVDAMTRAAQRGVDVRLHLDAAGSLFWGGHRFTRTLTQAGVRVRWFHRWSWHQPLRYNRRNHRKLLIVDAKCAYLGGFNIHRENSRAILGEQRWLDSHICVTGSLVRRAELLFMDFWNYHMQVSCSSKDVVQLWSNHNHDCRRRLRALYRDAFDHSVHSIYLVTPYFVPDLKTRNALEAAARRNVNVCLLLPRKSDMPIVRWAAQASYALLLDAGVKIYEYLPRVLHAKTVVVDGEWSAIGTANFDYRSFFVNYELVFTSGDRALGRQLEQQFLATLQQAEQITAVRWRRRPWLQRLLEGLAWLVRRWL